MLERLVSRRTLLKGLLTVPLWPAASWAFGDGARFVPAMVELGGQWNARLPALRRLAWELQKRTSVDVVLDSRTFPLGSPALMTYPFLYLGGQGALPTPTDAEVESLSRWLTYGGFLLVDANGGAQDSDFDQSVRALLHRALPDSPLEPLSFDDVVFKTYFLLDSAPGRLFDSPQLLAARVGKRAAVIYTRNDLLGAFAKDAAGNFEYPCTPGGEPQRELAMRLGINLCMYALCLDYKDDAVHLKLIMRKRR